MKFNLEILTDRDFEKIHDLTLSVLENPGMKIIDDRMLEALKKKGASVDFNKKTVSFNSKLINETIELMKNDLKNGRIPKYLNGVTSEKTDKQGIQAKFGGACVQYLDWEHKEYREPTENDLINMVKLGEAILEVATVGNPVVYLRDNSGQAIEPRMQRVKTAALVAKHTRKPGATEVWNAKELEYLMEIGIIIRGSKGEYLKNPCFITAKETIAPLILEENSAEVMIALVEKNLPVIIIPMPISGVSSPVNIYSNIVIGNAEILGASAALKAVCPEAMIIGGMISGSMDMATGTANFATPEATLQDLSLAELYDKYYGFNFGMGGYLDAKYPGIQNAIEKEFKYFVLAMSGRYTYPVGLVNWGKCFSAEQAMIDIQIAQNIHKFMEGVVISEEESILNQIREAGIGGSFLQQNHTLLNFKKNLMIPELFDHTLSQGYSNDYEKDIVNKASEKVRKILSSDNLYEISPEKSKAIDMVVAAAEKNL